MRILFNVMAAIEIPDADKFPPKEEAEKALAEIFENEGGIVHGLEISNYRAITDKGEDER